MSTLHMSELAVAKLEHVEERFVPSAAVPSSDPVSPCAHCLSSCALGVLLFLLPRAERICHTCPCTRFK
eukprot:8965527-Prorocentrum_lima.AAC.1